MHLILAVALLSLTLSGFPAFGADQPEVNVSLRVYKINRGAPGKENISPGDFANPGETIEYRAVYKNIGTAAARKLYGTLPIPKEMEYIPGSARPAAVQGSTDGVSYSAMPLKRKVKLSNGATANREVPVAEYRSLRWNLKELAPGTSIAVSARMKIKDNQKGPVVIKLDSVKKSDGKQKGGEK